MNQKTVSILLVLLLAGVGAAEWLSTGAAGTPTAPNARVVSNTNSGTTINVTLPGVELTPETQDGVSYDVVSIPGEVLAALDVGRPQVPKLSYLLGIPEDANVNVTVTELEVKTFEDVNCFPYQTPLTDAARNPFVIDRAAYARDELYPAFDAQVMNTGIWRELPVGNIQVYPVRYNPVTRQLRVVSRLQVNVTYTGGRYEHKVIKPWLAATYSRYIDNFAQLDFELGGTDNPGVKYLVIAHENWYNHSWLVDSLIGWHYKRGVETRLVHKSSWTAQEIKDTIRTEYARHDPAELRWVLLVGEYAQIPMYALGGVGRSDYWYSDFLPGGNTDNYPEIGLSRLSPTNADDLTNQVKKILTYEKNPPPTADWASKHALIACSELYPGKYSACIRGIYNEPMGWWRYDFDTLMCQYHGNDSIARIINEGRSVVTYRGHGDVDQWYTLARSGGAPWYISNVNQLTNGDLTPAVFNIACLCGDIYSATCLSEAWLRKYPGGASASFAATQASYTYPNHGICSTLVRSMCDTWTITVPGVRNYTCPTWDMGWIQNNVDAYVAKYWPGSPYPDNIYMYLNLGDPAMEVWAGGQPEAANVVYPPTIPMGPYNLPVAVTVGGNPVKNALVCAWKPGEFYIQGYTDATGNVTLGINASTPGEFSVTVSGGHAEANPPKPIIPFEGICTAGGGINPRVVYLRSTVVDTMPGNNDQVVNPGEGVVLPTWVKNVGGGAAAGVHGFMRTADPFVTVNDSSCFFGNIAAGDSDFTYTSPYRFTVAAGCTTGHRIDLTLQLRDDNDSSWISHIYFTVAAPKLLYSAQSIIDSPPGGNNNRRLDPEETADLVIALRNIGRAPAQTVAATLISGDPRLTVIDALGAFGTILPDSTKSNTLDRYRVTTASGIPPGTNIPCTLHITAAGGYQVVRGFIINVGWTFPPGAVLLTHDTGYCALTVSAIGTFGYDQPAKDAGNGFKYPKTAASGLYYGGMLCGNSASYMVDHYYGSPASQVQSDWTMFDSLRFWPPSISDEEIRGAYTDAGHSSPLGLKTNRASYQLASPGYDDWVAVIYDYENTGTGAINGLYSGVMCDFDIGTSSTNLARTDAVRRAAFMRQQSTANPCLGIKLLDPRLAANVSAIDHDRYVYPDSAMSESMKYRFLTGALSFPNSNRAYDWSVVVSAGPFDLPPATTYRVAYAIVGGTDSTNFLINCDSVQSWYDRSFPPQAVSESPLRLNVATLNITPNPFSGAMSIDYSAPIAGLLEVQAFDAAGRQVSVITRGPVKAGAGHVTWRPGTLANGIYFIKAILNGRESVTKALLLR